jgi:hypothetical protein
VRARPAAIVRLGRERTEEQLALGYVLESLDRLPSKLLRLRFLTALRALYAKTPAVRRADALLKLFTDLDAAHARVQTLVRTSGLAQTKLVARG